MSLSFIAAAAIVATPVADQIQPTPVPWSNCKVEYGQNPATLAYLQSLPGKIADDSVKPTTSGYVRLVATYSPCELSLPDFASRDYEKEKRDIIRRFFMHKMVNKTLTVNVSVRPVRVRASKILVSIGRDSGKEGETWATDVGNTLHILPYFRIEPNTTIELIAGYVSNRTYASSIASDTFDVINRATALITPATPLITASNKTRFNDLSTFVDTTINGLLRVEIKETLRSDSQLVGRDQILATLVLYTTGANDPYHRNTREIKRPVGRWDIEAKYFSGSLFSGVDDKSVTPSVASVLNFQVTDGKRVRDMLGGDSTVATARDDFLKTKDKANLENAAILCRLIASRADAEGFSAKDVSWIVAAYVQDMAPAAGSESPIRKGCGQAASVQAMYQLEAAGPD